MNLSLKGKVGVLRGTNCPCRPSWMSSLNRAAIPRVNPSTCSTADSLVIFPESARKRLSHTGTDNKCDKSHVKSSTALSAHKDAPQSRLIAPAS